MDLTRDLIREDAALILARLTEDPDWSLELLEHVRDQAELARRELADATREAEPTEAAGPDRPAADRWCDYCGATVGLTNDAQGLGSDPEWRCASTRACITRRGERFPLRQSERLALARQQDEYWRGSAEAGAAALTVHLAHQDQVSLTGPRLQAQSRPRPPAPDPWFWTEGARRARLTGRQRTA